MSIHIFLSYHLTNILGINQEWQSKAREEVLSFLGPNTSPTSETLNDLKLVSVCLIIVLFSKYFYKLKIYIQILRFFGHYFLIRIRVLF